MELRVLLEELLRRIPDLSISTVPEYLFGETAKAASTSDSGPAGIRPTAPYFCISRARTA